MTVLLPGIFEKPTFPQLLPESAAQEKPLEVEEAERAQMADFLQSETAAMLESGGVDPLVAANMDAVAVGADENEVDENELLQTPAWRMASGITHDYANKVGDYEHLASPIESSRRRAVQDWRNLAQATQTGTLESNRTDDEKAEFGLEFAGMLNYNLASGLINLADIENMPQEVALAQAALLEEYERLPPLSWNGTVRLIKALMTDPFTYAGGVGGMKIVQQLLAGGGTRALRQQLMRVALGGAAVGAEGSAYAAVGEYAMQRARFAPDLIHMADPDDMDEAAAQDQFFEPDWSAIRNAAAIGAGAGAGLGIAAGQAGNIVKGVRAGMRAVGRMAGDGSTLRSGIGPVDLFENINIDDRKLYKVNRQNLIDVMASVGAVPQRINTESSYFILPSGHRVRLANHPRIYDRSNADIDISDFTMRGENEPTYTGESLVTRIEQETGNLEPPNMWYLERLDNENTTMAERIDHRLGWKQSNNTPEYETYTDQQILRTINDGMHRNASVDIAAVETALDRKIFTNEAVKNIRKAVVNSMESDEKYRESLRDKRYKNEYRLKKGFNVEQRVQSIIESTEKRQEFLDRINAAYPEDQLTIPGAAPDRTDYSLVRFQAPRGASPRVQELAKRINQKPEVANEFRDLASAGEEIGRDWYNTEELLERFVDHLGSEAGTAAWKDYLWLVGATSTGSKVKPNIRNASYYYTIGIDELRAVADELMAGQRTPPKGSGYGHKMQKNQAMNVARYVTGEWGAEADPRLNPKPRGFAQSLTGSQRNIAADKHFMRMLGMMSDDPRFLHGSAEISKTLVDELREKYGKQIGPYIKTRDVNGKPAYNFNAKKAVKEGPDGLFEFIKEKAAVWEDMPNDNEYDFLEKFAGEIGREMNMTAPQFQAALWMGAAQKTGVDATSQFTFMKIFNDLVEERAKERGISVEEVIRRFVTGEQALLVPLAVGGAAASQIEMTDDSSPDT